MSVTLEMFRNDPNGEDYPAGHTVFAEGDPGDAMYVVLEGKWN